VVNAGADDFIAKPVFGQELCSRLETCLLRQNSPVNKANYRITKTGILPKFAGVCIAASTGGPPAVAEVVSKLTATDKAAFFIIMHGPKWMLETFSERLDSLTQMPVSLALNGLQIKPGNIYLAPGDQHTVINPVKMELALNDDPPENFVRPSADPLFRSAAGKFQSHSIGVVLTGMGRDATVGCGYIAAAGGRVIAQDPSTAVLPSMPESIINLRIADTIAPLSLVASTINKMIPEVLSNTL
jgi:two-component system chemotaxis response regulator CheB